MRLNTLKEFLSKYRNWIKFNIYREINRKNKINIKHYSIFACLYTRNVPYFIISINYTLRIYYCTQVYPRQQDDTLLTFFHVFC